MKGNKILVGKWSRKIVLEEAVLKIAGFEDWKAIVPFRAG